MIRAIQTAYSGYRFRSRLEARWAVFFDAIGIEYEYEPEGFNLNGARYLPDFWLPSLKYLIEIKGQSPTPKEELLVTELSEHLGARKGFILWGSIPQGGSIWDWGSEGWHLLWPIWDNGHCWCLCPDCGQPGFEFEGRTDRISCKQPRGPCPTHGSDKHIIIDDTRLMAAYAAARQARFEYGETPQWPVAE